MQSFFFTRKMVVYFVRISPKHLILLSHTHTQTPFYDHLGGYLRTVGILLCFSYAVNTGNNGPELSVTPLQISVFLHLFQTFLVSSSGPEHSQSPSTPNPSQGQPPGSLAAIHSVPPSGSPATHADGHLLGLLWHTTWSCFAAFNSDPLCATRIAIALLGVDWGSVFAKWAFACLVRQRCHRD